MTDGRDIGTFEGIAMKESHNGPVVKIKTDDETVKFLVGSREDALTIYRASHGIWDAVESSKGVNDD